MNETWPDDLNKTLTIAQDLKKKNQKLLLSS